MSKVAIPVSHQNLWATGDVALWVEVTLAIRDGSGHFVNRCSIVDSGAQITTFPAYDTKQLGLHLSAAPAPLVHEQTGLEVRSGMLAFRIVGLDQTLYAVSCLFLGDPNTPPDPNAPLATFPRNLLQPLHLLDVLDFQTHKDPASIGAPYGELMIEKK
jgi:hypothetical protein